MQLGFANLAQMAAKMPDYPRGREGNGGPDDTNDTGGCGDSSRTRGGNSGGPDDTSDSGGCGSGSRDSGGVSGPDGSYGGFDEYH